MGFSPFAKMDTLTDLRNFHIVLHQIVDRTHCYDYVNVNFITTYKKPGKIFNETKDLLPTIGK
jgi:hypothetical protein